jgi:PAS domain S-box-containing protein
VRLAGGPQITVIEAVPYSQLLAANTAVPSLLGALVVVLCTLPLAVILARSLSRPLVQMTEAVEAFSRNESIVVPTNARGEIGVLARAFSRMAADMRERTAALQRTTEERRLADEKFRLAVEASPSGLAMIDGKGAIVLVNAETERLFGYERHELIGRSVDILVPASQRSHHVRHRIAFVTRPEARRMGAGRDLHGVRKDGSEFPVEIGINPIQTSQGLLVLSVIVDITERKRAETELRAYAERAAFHRRGGIVKRCNRDQEPRWRDHWLE